MIKKLQIYRCPVCGTIVELLDSYGRDLVCCGPLMVRLKEKIADEGDEEHMPIIETNAAGITVSVGERPHPMETQHYLKWIEIDFDSKRYRKSLKPGQEPVATFDVWPQHVLVRAYCSVHGLWIGAQRCPVH